ncbi:MAG: ABC transporter ATP-binding protein [Rhodospirillaceae bacterium]|nr:ABC transporter ATP-binding protein [Rhodospirillaceae bacterium]
MLELNDLSKRFGRRVALDGVSLSVGEEEILALLGPTGAGKTTALRCVAGVEKPDRGSVTLRGEDVTRTSPMFRDLAMVFEGFNLIPVLNTFDNIAFPLRSPVHQSPEEDIRKMVTKAAADLHIDHLLDRPVEKLSGGERQRVAIARALVRRPAAYLLDEPLSALDLKLREELRVELRALHRSHRSAILYATNDYHGAAALGDRIALIDGGRIVQTDTLATLIDHPQHVLVGKLIGSPSMAVLNATSRDGGVAIDGTDHVVSYAELGIAAPAGGQVKLGLWPEVIELADHELAGALQGTVQASEFRGLERVVQVELGGQTFRKTVATSFDATFGRPCWMRFPAARMFVFDGETGVRIGKAAPDLAKR